MAVREVRFSVSVTEVPQFRRLVEFVADVEGYARLAYDHDLMRMVEELREDLRDLRAS
jgi:uncharacterized glyoxalase superfamily metalloenzyme YdcJ